MNRSEAFAKISAVVAEQLGVDAANIREDSLLVDELGADSLDMVEIVMNLEEVFDINIVEGDEENLDKLKTVADMLDYVMQQA